VIRFKLSVMMFLEFFIWGAWFPLAYNYLTTLEFTEAQKTWVMNAFALASITALFFSNQFADRNFSAEKFMAFSHLVGGLAILGIVWVDTFWPFFGLLLLHSLFYVPTISISNSIAFANLRDPQREFGPVRLWGTIGWIAASVPFVFILADWSQVRPLGEVGFVSWLGDALGTPRTGAAYREGVSYTFVVAGIASLLLAAYSLTLPHTPPKPARGEEERFAWLESMRLLEKPFLLVLFIATFIDATVHQGYFLLTANYLTNQVGVAGQWVMPVMSIGQVAEILTMAILGLVLKSLGWRATMILGILGHAARFTVFAFFPEPAPAILINVLHGICYAFFFATVYIFVDEFFPKDARSSAQGLFNFLILGFGPLAGNFLWPQLEGTFTGEGGRVDYQTLFLFPAGMALAAALLLFLFFHPPAKGEGELPPHARDALDRDAAWAPAPSDAITDRDRQKAPEGVKAPDQPVPPPGAITEP
jgi:nucleoside transporter